MEKTSQRDTEFLLHVETLRKIVSEPNSIKAQQLYAMIRYNLICHDPTFPEIQVGLLYFCRLSGIPIDYLDFISSAFSLIMNSLVSSFEKRIGLNEMKKKLNMSEDDVKRFLFRFNHWLERIELFDQDILNKRLLKYFEINARIPNYRPDVPIDIQLRGENDIKIYYILKRLLEEDPEKIIVLSSNPVTNIGYLVLITRFQLLNPKKRLSFRHISKEHMIAQDELYNSLVIALIALGIDIVPAKWDIK